MKNKAWREMAFEPDQSNLCRIQLPPVVSMFAIRKSATNLDTPQQQLNFSECLASFGTFGGDFSSCRLYSPGTSRDLILTAVAECLPCRRTYYLVFQPACCLSSELLLTLCWHSKQGFLLLHWPGRYRSTRLHAQLWCSGELEAFVGPSSKLNFRTFFDAAIKLEYFSASQGFQLC